MDCQQRRPWRTWMARLAVAVLAPAIVIGAVEGVLHGLGIGFPSQLFVDAGDGVHLTGNDRFAWRFFPPELARTPPNLYVSRTKSADTLRVFVLGGSAAMGTPEPAFGLARTLQVQLQAHHPDRRVEVHNVAMAAINSHVVRSIAHECARLEPDLMIVLTGNNEVVGPYGPGTVFQRGSLSLSLIRLSMRARSLRVGQLFERTIRRTAGTATPGSWRGLEMFLGRTVSASDPRLDAVASNLESNLRAISRSAEAAGVPVILSTVGVNLKDSAPFASLHRSDVSAADRERVARLLAITVAPETSMDEAIVAANEATQVDDQYAEAHFQRGRLLAAFGRTDEALEALKRARDSDALRFRADSRINRVIARVGADEPNAHLVDGAAVLAAAPETVAGLLGGELFWEHVHLRFSATYHLAAAISETADDILNLKPTAPAASLDDCRRRLALTSWDEHGMVHTIWRMTRRAPFTAQSNNKEQTQRLARQLARARLGLDLPASQQTLAATHHSNPTDLDTGTRLAELYQQSGRFDQAIEIWQELLALIPDQVAWRTQLAFARLDSGQSRAAVTELQRVVKARPHQPSAHVNLGIALNATGRTSEARQAFERALELNPVSTAARLNLGALHAANGRLDRAESTYREVVASDPRSAEGHRRLGEILSARDRRGDAAVAFQTAFKLDPADPRNGTALAEELVEQGELVPAIEVLDRTAAMAPTATTVLALLGELHLALGHPAEAASALRRALAQEPTFASARINLAVALQMLDQPRAAVEAYTTLLHHHPDHVHARLGLGWLLATTSEPGLRDRERARQLLDEALRTIDDDVNAMVSAATLATAIGDRNRARQILTAALGLAKRRGDDRALAAIGDRLAALSTSSGSAQ